MDLYNVFYDCHLKDVHFEMICETEIFNKNPNFILVKSNVSDGWIEEYIDQNFHSDFLTLEDLKYFVKYTDDIYTIDKN